MREPILFGFGFDGDAGAQENMSVGGYDLEEPPSASSGDTAVMINYIINVFIDSIFTILGFFGSALTLHILRTDKKKSSNSLFLFVLAVYDILILVFTVLYTVLRSIYPATGALEMYYRMASPYVIAYVLPVGWIAQTGCIWFTSLAAADRYVAINFPLKATQICTIPRARKVAIAASVSAVLFNFPRFLHYHLVAFYSNRTDGTFVSHVKVDLPEWNSRIYHYVYHIGVTMIFLYLIPLGSIIFFNVKLISALRKASKFRSKMNNDKRRNQSNQITLNLVVMVTKFIICQTPDFIASILGAIPEIKSSPWFQLFSTFKEMLIVLNSSANFYIYLVFNHKFREKFLRIITCKDRGRKRSTNTSYYASSAFTSRVCNNTIQQSETTETTITNVKEIKGQPVRSEKDSKCHTHIMVKHISSLAARQS